MKKNKKFHLCNTDNFVVVIAVREDKYGKTAYIFDKYADEEEAKKALSVGGLPIEKYRVFNCNHLKDIVIKQEIKEIK